jgi:hypothetical protein
VATGLILVEEDPPARPGKDDPDDADAAVDSAVEDLLAADESGAGPPAGPAPAAETAGAVALAALTEPSPRLVKCPLCRITALPGETLPGGRFRCQHCKAVFSWSPLTDPRSAAAGKDPKRGRKHRRRDDEEEPSFLRKCARPVPLAAAGAAAVLLLYLGFPGFLFGTSGRVPVHPARGQAYFAGKPMANAAIFLEPVDAKGPEFPRPRGTVQGDGSFVLGTYGKEDGAPAGEYRVALQWHRKQTRAEQDDGRPLVSLLPRRYGRAQTSGLTVQIQEGENQLPAIRLRR